MKLMRTIRPIALGLLLLVMSGCYVSSGMYRLTEVRFNGMNQPDDDCTVMIVRDNMLTCVLEEEK